MRKMLYPLAALISLALAQPIEAQSNPGFVFGQVPTAAQWNALFSGKQDLLVAQANSVLGGAAAGGSPIWLPIPNCNGTSQAIIWTVNAGWGCNTLSIGGGNVTASGTLTSNDLIVGQGGTAVAALATANNSVLVTNGSGVPSLAMTLPSGLTIPTPTFTGTITFPSSSIPNSALVNSGMTIGSTNVSLGGTAATITGLTLTSPVLNGTITGTGLTTYLASPPAIGGTTPAAVTGSIVTGSASSSGAQSNPLFAVNNNGAANTSVSLTLQPSTTSTRVAQIVAVNNGSNTITTNFINNLGASADTILSLVPSGPVGLTVTSSTGQVNISSTGAIVQQVPSGSASIFQVNGSAVATIDATGIDNTAIGQTTPAAGSVTNLAISGTISGAGITSLFASPPPIGLTTPNTISGTNIFATTGMFVTAGVGQAISLTGTSNPQVKISATNVAGNSAGLFIENQGLRNWEVWADRATDTFMFGTNSRASTYAQISNTGVFSVSSGLANSVTLAGSATNPLLGVTGGTLASTGGLALGAGAGTASSGSGINSTLNVLGTTSATGQFYASSGGTDQKTWDYGITSSGATFRIRILNDAFSAATAAYQIDAGTTYNILDHKWNTSTTAGTPVQGMTLTTNNFQIGNGTYNSFVANSPGANLWVDYVLAQGGATGAGPSLQAAGSDTNIPFALSAKGTGAVLVQTGGGGRNQFAVLDNASGADYVTVTSGASAGQLLTNAGGLNIAPNSGATTVTGTLGISSLTASSPVCTNSSDILATTCPGLISTQTAAASAALAWTGLSSTYNNYHLSCQNIVLSAAQATLYIQFGSGSTPNYDISGYEWAGVNTTNVPLSTAAGSASASGIEVTGNTSIGTTATTGYSFDAQVYGFISTTGQTGAAGKGELASIGTAANFGGTDTATVGVKTAVRVIPASGTITTGSCTLSSLPN